MNPRRGARLSFSAACAAALSVMLAAAPVQACWNGYAASVGGVQMNAPGGSGAWSQADARRAARWGSRISALLPPDASLTLHHRSALCEGSGCGALTEFELEPELPKAFEHVAKAFAVSPATRESALKADAQVFTVQVFAGSFAGARAAKSRVIDLDGGFFGFYIAGGFPAQNDDAHIVRDGALHRVVAGAYLDHASADAARVELEAAGLKGFVRELPPGEVVDERSFSMEG